MRKASIWEVVVAELARLEAQGKDDPRDSWMGNAIKAVNRLEEHCRKHNAYPASELDQEALDRASWELQRALKACELAAERLRDGGTFPIKGQTWAMLRDAIAKAIGK